MVREKKLTVKQQMALDMLTSGVGYTYKEIAETVGVSPKTLWDWRTGKDFVIFQEEMEKRNEQRWLATVDIAREAARQLCEERNPKMVEFVLKNAGYNPTTKVEADITNDIVINIGE